MQSLHRGSFCAQRWRETRRGSDAKHDERAEVIRRDARRDSWNFSPYLRLVYHKALSGTYQKIHWSVQKVLASTHRRIFG